MKIFKRGFTLAEVLLCLAVIGIVMAMGMKVTRNVTERAYNKYWAIGYENLYDVLRDMHTRQGNEADSYWNNLANNPADFITELRTYFSPSSQIPVNTIPENGETCVGLFFSSSCVPSRLLDNNRNLLWVSTNNGIRYSVVGYRNVDTPHFIILMSVPQPATNTNNGQGITFFYFEPDRFNNDRYMALIPMRPEDVRALHNDDENHDIIPMLGLNNAQLVDLQSSPLLGFTTGREDPPRVRNYHEAFCNRNTGAGNNNRYGCNAADDPHCIIQCDDVTAGAPAGQLNWYKR